LTFPRPWVGCWVSQENSAAPLLSFKFVVCKVGISARAGGLRLIANAPCQSLASALSLLQELLPASGTSALVSSFSCWGFQYYIAARLDIIIYLFGDWFPRCSLSLWVQSSADVVRHLLERAARCRITMNLTGDEGKLSVSTWLPLPESVNVTIRLLSSIL
jgi:hypothetical protein